MTKRNLGSSSTGPVDESRRKMIRDGIALAGVTFTGLLPACGGTGGGDGESSTSTGVLDESSTNSGELDVKFETVRFTLTPDPAPTTQTIFLSPGFGVPKGIMLIQTGDKTPGLGYANSSFCIGYSDGTNEISVHAQHDSESTPGQKCFRGMWNTQCSFRIQSTANSGVRNAISVDSFGTDQIVLSIDDYFNPALETFECIIIAIGGDGVESVIVGSHDDLGVTASPVPITVGHAPDLFFTLTSNHDAFNFKGQYTGGYRSAETDCNVSYGVAVNDGSNSQMGVSWFSNDGPSSNPATNTVGIYNDSILASMADGAVENYSVSVTSFDANGVTLTPSANPENTIFGYMSIKFAQNVNMAIVDTTVPTSGDISVAGAGFQPGFGMWFNFSGAASYNVPADSTFSLCTAVFDDANIYSAMNNGLDHMTNFDGAARARAGSAFQMLNIGGSNGIDVEASGYSFTPDGVDFTMTNWPSTPIIGRMLLLGVS